MTNLTEYLKSHQLIAYFVLTYVFTWTLLILFQPIYLAGQRIVLGEDIEGFSKNLVRVVPGFSSRLAFSMFLCGNGLSHRSL